VEWFVSLCFACYVLSERLIGAVDPIIPFFVLRTLTRRTLTRVTRVIVRLLHLDLTLVADHPLVRSIVRIVIRMDLSMLVSRCLTAIPTPVGLPVEPNVPAQAVHPSSPLKVAPLQPMSQADFDRTMRVISSPAVNSRR
jgi:hypothetical protein